jgi:hypothetical protein
MIKNIFRRISPSVNDLSTARKRFHILIAVEVYADLTAPVWAPLLCTNVVNGSIFFTDSQATNYGARFYRISSP